MPRLLGVLLFVCLAASIRYLAPGFFFDASSAVFGPLWSGQNALSRGLISVTAYFHTKSGLEEQILELEGRLLEQTADINRVRILEAENAGLKSALGRTPDIKKKLAYILRKPPLSPYDTFVIDVGSEGGAAVGQRVLARGDILVGEIVEVTETVSKVRLYSSQGIEMPVNVGTSSVQSMAVGQGGGSFEVEALRELPVAIGDPVSIPGMDSVLFGTVEAVDSDPVEPFKSVFVRSPVNVFELPWVEIDLSEKR